MLRPRSRSGEPRSARPVVGALVAASLALAAAACDGPADLTGRLLELAPAQAEVVVAIAPAQVTGTWLERTVTALVEGSVPACVLAEVRAAPAVMVAWAADAGALIAIAGREGGACPELVRRGADRVWAEGLDPGSGKDRFFAGRERRRRWSDLAAAPVRAMAELELAAGVVVHARGTADPRAGVVARVIVAADDRTTLLSLRERYLRWRTGLDHERLGGAWPAIAAITTAEDRTDPERSADVVELRLGGEDGATAAALAVSALGSGLGGAAARLPCADNLGDFTGRAACQDGELTLTEDLRDELFADPSALIAGVRVVPATRHGAFVGVRIDALSAQDPLTWLGLMNGDIIDVVDGQPLTGGDQVLDGFRSLTTAHELELGVTRRGRHGTLRFRVR